MFLRRREGRAWRHCSLPPGQTSLAVAHRTVEEVWYFLGGRGEVWRKLDEHEEVVEVSRGVSLSIPLGAHFQFRNTGDKPLQFVLTSIPPWPGRRRGLPRRWPLANEGGLTRWGALFREEHDPRDTL